MTTPHYSSLTQCIERYQKLLPKKTYVLTHIVHDNNTKIPSLPILEEVDTQSAYSVGQAPQSQPRSLFSLQRAGNDGGRVLYKAPSTAGVHSRLQSRIPYCRVENVTPPKPLARHSSLACCGMRRLAFKLLAWPRGAVQLARHGSSLAAALPRVQCAAKTRLCGLFSVFFGSLAARGLADG